MVKVLLYGVTCVLLTFPVRTRVPSSRPLTFVVFLWNKGTEGGHDRPNLNLLGFRPILRRPTFRLGPLEPTKTPVPTYKFGVFFLNRTVVGGGPGPGKHLQRVTYLLETVPHPIFSDLC